MSLHAQVSPAAHAALAAQKRNSSIAAIIISILVLILLCLLLWLKALLIPTMTVEPIVAYQGDPMSEEELTKPKVTTSVKKKPSSPSSASSPVITAKAPSAMAIPNPEITFDTPSPEFGSSDGFGDGFGDGDGDGFGGSGGGFSAIPATMKKRCSPQERLARLKEMGGSEKHEAAVIKALDWMTAKQKGDGSFSNRSPVAMTGLTVLCYLGHCETPLSPKYGEAVENAIVYLVGVSKKNDGKLGSDLADKHWAYEHAIATYALAEAYTFCNLINYDIPGLKESVQSAGNILINGQTDKGGWRYSFAYDQHHNDTSVSGFCLQALKACKHTGIRFAKMRKTGKKGMGYIKASQSDNGMIGYSGKGGARDTMTGAGLLCMQQWGEGRSREAKKALKHLEGAVKFQYTSSNLYGHYYYGQAFMEAGGKYWTNYNALFANEILSGQRPDGSFGSTSTFSRFKYYETCLGTLMLEVYYRFLPGTSKK